MNGPLPLFWLGACALAHERMPEACEKGVGGGKEAALAGVGVARGTGMSGHAPRCLRLSLSLSLSFASGSAPARLSQRTRIRKWSLLGCTTKKKTKQRNREKQRDKGTKAHNYRGMGDCLAGFPKLAVLRLTEGRVCCRRCLVAPSPTPSGPSPTFAEKRTGRGGAHAQTWAEVSGCLRTPSSALYDASFPSLLSYRFSDTVLLRFVFP